MKLTTFFCQFLDSIHHPSAVDSRTVLDPHSPSCSEAESTGIIPILPAEALVPVFTCFDTRIDRVPRF